MWRIVSRGLGLVVVLVQLRQVLIGEPVDQGMLLLAAGLLGVPSMFRRDAE